MRVTITFYGYPDNDDGQGHFGTAIIAHELQWQGHPRHVDDQGLPYAGGTGTFADPITAAASHDNAFLPPGTLVYVSDLEKYFFIEDECASCTDEAWLDVWMESSSASDSAAVEQCEDIWTGDDTLLHEIVIDPAPGLKVDPSPFIDPVTGECTRPKHLQSARADPPRTK